MVPSGGAAMYAIAFMTAGVFLTVIFFVGAALIVVGHFKPSRALQRAGWIVLAVWAVPAAAWTYHLQVLTEPDHYRTLQKSEVIYGVPLPAGAQVNLRRWARRVQWATFTTPQAIQGVEYVTQVNFCGSHVCSGVLARDQDIQGLPCRAKTDVHFSEETDQLTWCTLARPFARQGVTWPAGTTLQIDSDGSDSYRLAEDAEPVLVTGLLVHSGLVVEFTPAGQLSEIHRDQSQRGADTHLEIGGIFLKSDQYRFESDGTIRGGVLARDAVINGQPMKTGDPVVIPLPGH
jgi:hypothetical protein